MKVFVTGGSGFIGTQVVDQLISSGHEVLALARSDSSQAALEKFGSKVTVLRGDILDTDILKKGASESEGTIHLGFIHDFSKYEECCEIDQKATIAMCEALKGTNKPFIYTSGTLLLPHGKLGVETDNIDPKETNLRGKTEQIALSYAKSDVRAMSIRLSPTVHGEGDHGFIPAIINIAKNKGISSYIEEGLNSWSAVHKKDAAALFVLSLEKGSPGKAYHAAAEQSIKTKDIAEIIGKVFNLPVGSVPRGKAVEHFGFFGIFFGFDNPISSEITRKELGWNPKHFTLFEDILAGFY